jgi:Carbohydrate family 9 binding domain-like
MIRLSERVMGALLVLHLGACVEQTPDVPTEEDLKAARANILSSAPTPKVPINANLENKVTILGVDVDTDAVEGSKPFTVTTYFKVNQPPGDGWRLFFHVNGAQKTQFINHDHTPLAGKYPVSQWKAGEILRDVYRVALPPNFDSPDASVYVGLWKGPLRMKVTSGPNDGDNRVLLVKLPIKQAGQPLQSSGPVAGRKRYVARKVKTPPKLDGKLDDAAWKDAPASDAFVNTLTGAPVEQKTTAKMVWDDKNLYIAFDNVDADVWAELTKHDDKLWTQEVDEVMIDADGDGKTYIELQVAPNGTTFDSYLPMYRQNQNDWESGMKTAVKVDGTLNKRTDTDKGWSVEIALPLEAVKGRAEKGPQLPPKLGDVWRINLYRMDSPKGKAQVGSGWSPPMVGDFHALDKFGELVFGDEKGAAPLPPATAVSAPGPAIPPAGPRLGPKGVPLHSPAQQQLLKPQAAGPASKKSAKQ